jgi:hypothetical protein
MGHARGHEQELARLIGEEKCADFIATLRRIAEAMQQNGG